VYGPADYVERWNGVFDWLDAPPTEAGTLSRSVLGLAAALGRYGVTKRALARGIGMDPSLVGKILSGKRRCPHGFLDRSYERLEGQEGRSSEVVVPASYGVAAGSILAPALEYLRRGWSVSRRGSHRSAIGGWKW
jgi:hypothetical protein